MLGEWFSSVDDHNNWEIPSNSDSWSNPNVRNRLDPFNPSSTSLYLSFQRIHYPRQFRASLYSVVRLKVHPSIWFSAKLFLRSNFIKKDRLHNQFLRRNYLAFKFSVVFLPKCLICPFMRNRRWNNKIEQWERQCMATRGVGKISHLFQIRLSGWDFKIILVSKCRDDFRFWHFLKNGKPIGLYVL